MNFTSTAYFRPFVCEDFTFSKAEKHLFDGE